jgi:hypothetical protein
MARRAPDRSTGDGAGVFADHGELTEMAPTTSMAPVGPASSEPDLEPVPARAEDTDPGPVASPGPAIAAAQPAPAPFGPARSDGIAPLAPESPGPANPGWVPPPPPVGARNGPPDRPVAVRSRQPRGPRVVQGRRSRRVVRRIDSWTVFKLSFLFYLCGGLILLIAGIALWNIAGAFDVITNVEKFIQKLFDLQSFKLQADAILGYSAIGAAVLVLLGTGANVLMALLYNLISDVIGGVQVIVLEETDIDSQTTSERAKGRIRGRTDDRITRRRDRPPADDAAVSP